MESKLNLVELLKGKEGIELWSPSFGTAKLHKVYLDNKPRPITVLTPDNTLYLFSSKGTVDDCIDAITLFPSEYAYKTGRGWQDFNKPKRLIIANAGEYEPMRHWIKGIRGISTQQQKALRGLTGLNFKFDNNGLAYYKDPANGAKRCLEFGIMNKGIMPEFEPQFVEVEDKPELTDKCVVWCWDNEDMATRQLAFYNAKTERTFRYDGSRSGYRWDNYEACTNPEVLAMMEPLRVNLED